ncbi:hypothetical protein Pmar_PMAR009564 [Perkinsus marinus ATCC 50983]|uniref:EF-hand domain-containing protein n=1 Tax=Perkinsus marinus (strain ATCC 50983 / TXsc) TaxID=423536 RepID=C5KEJ1_PERM5|nr:hypothetical protein Pmar_PMAR009564 [Perkinsus marinus ATCC 50983]EER17129.1 hypothetical protein Pmar_PMAR009564 [Perkinsus marinus ATCC 50983]|eukprot:XP_002785333.1 hypothetical protein Pmar_PMAR009564 [Perkinsus marinus ATCC 50983]
MRDSTVAGSRPPPTTAGSGLQEGYSAEQWGPWRSHGLLLQQCIRQLKWQDNATALLKLMKQYACKPQSLNREEFTRLLEGIALYSHMRLVTSLTDYSITDNDAHITAQQLWEVFDRDQDGLLSETDLLAGLIAVDPFTPHDLESPSGMLRMQFIFLYFDEDKNGQLDLKETTGLVMHLRQLTRATGGALRSASSSSSTTLETLAELRASSIVEAKTLLSEAGSASAALTYKLFYEAVKNGSINGKAAPSVSQHTCSIRD